TDRACRIRINGSPGAALRAHAMTKYTIGGHANHHLLIAGPCQRFRRSSLIGHIRSKHYIIQTPSNDLAECSQMSGRTAEAADVFVSLVKSITLCRTPFKDEQQRRVEVAEVCEPQLAGQQWQNDGHRFRREHCAGG